MTQNRVRATLAPADRDAVLNSIAAIREKLPFLIDLTADKRNEIVKLGDKSRAFVTKAFEVASHNPDLLPRSFNLEEMGKTSSFLPISSRYCVRSISCRI